LKALQADPATKVILMVSKLPDEEVEKTLLAQAAKSSKPTVICLIGGKTRSDKVPANVTVVSTLEEGGLVAAELAGAKLGDIKAKLAKETKEAEKLAKELKAQLKPGQKNLRALFSGGTLCYESQVIWRDQFGLEVYSNAPLDKHFKMKDSTRSENNVAVDLGEEEFTVGRPHPMIDNDLRMRRILQEAADPSVAKIFATCSMATAVRKGSSHFLQRYAGMGTPHTRWRDRHQSGRTSIMPRIRSRPQAGIHCVRSISSRACWRRLALSPKSPRRANH